jgi:prepilin-type N-terminal cleavage/methylation domain-containing protein
MKFLESESLAKREMKRFNQTMSARCCRQILTDRRGFSLGEILVAVGVFSILAAIAVPQFVAFQPRLRLEGATRQIYSELMWARSKAVNDNSSYVVTFPTNQTMLITGLTTKTINIQTEYSDVTLASSASTVTFSSRGTADVAPTITLTNSVGTKTVILRITGTASIS